MARLATTGPRLHHTNVPAIRTIVGGGQSRRHTVAQTWNGTLSLVVGIFALHGHSLALASLSGSTQLLVR